MENIANSQAVALIVTSSRWFPTARLGMALTKVGFTVDAVCPSRHSIRATKNIRNIYNYDGLSSLESFRDAIEKSQASIIIPCDDRTVFSLHEIHRTADTKTEIGRDCRAVIERSLGARESFSIIESRTAFTQVAGELGIRVPATEAISGVGALTGAIDRLGLPMALKADGTSGGDGVRVAHSFDEAKRAFRKLQAPPLVIRALKRALIDQDSSLIRPSLSRRKYTVSGQAYIRGREATSTIACWKGVVLAGLHFDVVKKSSANGPSTVLRLTENAEMITAAEKIVRRLRLSGFIGFDYMIDEKGDAYLIEINPRSTQVGHLPLGPGRNLPAALFAAATGVSTEIPPAITDKDTIALFPFEWLRDPASPFLASGYHDVPWGEDDFIRACVAASRAKKASHSQPDWISSLSPVRAPRR